MATRMSMRTPAARGVMVHTGVLARACALQETGPCYMLTIRIIIQQEINVIDSYRKVIKRC